MELKKTAAELAKDAILEALAGEPVQSTELVEDLITKGHARWTILMARRELARAGRIRTFRPGARSNPYFVELIDSE